MIYIMPLCNSCINTQYCDNTIILNNEEHKLEKIWRKTKKDLTKDIKGVIFPYPKHNTNVNPDNNDIIERLKIINIYLENNKNIIKYDSPRSCLICNKNNISTMQFVYNNIIWEDGLIHYIKVHNIIPSIQFKYFIFNIDIIKKINNKLNITLHIVSKNNNKYVMIERKQLLILDAIMIHGGYNKKYIDEDDKTILRYSEHSGYLNFNNNKLSKIIVSGIINKISDDNEIYFPSSFDKDMYKYEYIFHTHPPTPKPGGRVLENILYELPSIGDIFHFIEHFENGKVLGSLVITSEGLYNIRSLALKLNIDEDKLFTEYENVCEKIQMQAIKKYGVNFTTYIFYSKISQNIKYIQKLNKVLKTFNLQIDYYPRKKTIHNKWILDTIFLIF